MPSLIPVEPAPSKYQLIFAAAVSALAAAVAFAIGDFVNGPRAGVPIAAGVFTGGVGPRLMEWACRSRPR